MNFRQLLAVAAAASLLVPGTALAGKGNGKPTGKPGAAPAAQAGPNTFKIRTLEGPAESPENVTTPAPTPATESPESGEVVEAPATDKAARKAAKKAERAARKAAKKACKRLSKKRVKGQRGTPYSRCIVAAAKKRRQQPVEQAPVEPAPVEFAPVDPAPEPEPELEPAPDPAPVDPAPEPEPAPTV